MLKISNKTKNKINEIIKDKKESLKTFTDMHKEKKFRLAFLVITLIFMSAQIYSLSNWENTNKKFSEIVTKTEEKNNQEEAKNENVEVEKEAEKEKVTYVEFTKNRFGYKTTTPFLKDVAQDVMSLLILMICCYLPLVYMPYLLTPFLALNLASLVSIYKSCGAVMPLVVIATTLKIVAYSYCIAIGSIMYQNERNKYKYKSLKSYNSYDFRVSLQNIFGTKEKAEKLSKTKAKKVEKAKQKVKKIGIENITFALIVASIAVSIAKVIFMLSV